MQQYITDITAIKAMHLAGYTPINHVRKALWKACLSPASVGVQENIIKGKDQSVRMPSNSQNLVAVQNS